MKKAVPYLLLFIVTACTKDKFSTSNPDSSCYPKEVAEILVNKCATAGCHNSQSAGNANGLDYSTWENMFKGGKNGSSVIPFSTDYSYMLYFINTDTAEGLSLSPRMPYLQTALSKTEYHTLRDWIANGAPNCDGYVNFSDDPNRKKVYACMQPCNKVAVFDAASRVIMRYINVGNGIGGPHQVRVTPDGKYWCVVFYPSNILQVFRTTDDTEVGQITLDGGNIEYWNTVSFTSDSKYGFVSDLESGGKISMVNFETMSEERIIGGLANAHGTYVTKEDSFLYVTSQYGSLLYKVHLKDDLNPYSYDPVSLGPGSPDVHEIIFTPDESKYFVSCQSTNEVRVFSRATDQLLATIPVGVKPQEFSISPKNNWIFVTCTEDSLSPGNSSAQKGSVYVIDYTTNTIVTHLYPGFQPHGIAVDEDHDMVFVANLNYDGGVAPHHLSNCGGTDGYITIIDMLTLQLLKVTLPDGTQFTYKNEVLQQPYFICYRK